MSPLPFTADDVMRKAIEIVEAGGDPNPCHFGAFCPRCCLALAKEALDTKHSVSPPWWEMTEFFQEVETDRPLSEAVARLNKALTDGTQAAAVALLRSALNEP